MQAEFINQISRKNHVCIFRFTNERKVPCLPHPYDVHFVAFALGVAHLEVSGYFSAAVLAILQLRAA